MASIKKISINTQALQSWLDSKRISHYRFAKASGVSEGSLSQIFKYKSASPYHVMLISGATGIKLAELAPDHPVLKSLGAWK